MKFLLKRTVIALAVFILLPTVALAVNGNTFFGNGAGVSITTGAENTFIGEGAGSINSTGGRNTFLGTYAGVDSNGDDNTFIGYNTGKQNTLGSRNVMIGEAAGFKNTTGEANNFIGYRTGFENTTGQGNTGLGESAGFDNKTGSYNVFLGYAAGFYETGSNKLHISNHGTTTPLIYGDFATDEVTINSTLKTTTLCLSGDCRTAWPAGGGGSTTVDKDEINNVGILGFEWNDSEVADTLTIGSAGSVSIGALPMSTTGITNGNTTEIATVDDIYDFVLANADTPSLWTESGADIYRPTGKVGIGTSTPSATLDVDGNTKLRGEVRADGLLILTPMSESVRPACNSTTEGAISYSKDDDKFYGCNGKKWKKLN